LLKVLEKYNYLLKTHPVINTGMNEDKIKDDRSANRSDSIIPPFSQIVSCSNIKTSPLKRNTNGIVAMGMPGSKWQTKKKPQLQWMTRQIRTVLESHPEFGKRKLTILDIGGGKGALANFLGQKLGQYIRVHVVDISMGCCEERQKKSETT